MVADVAGAHRDILCGQDERVVGNDDCVRYRRLSLQLQGPAAAALRQKGGSKSTALRTARARSSTERAAWPAGGPTAARSTAISRGPPDAAGRPGPVDLGTSLRLAHRPHRLHHHNGGQPLCYQRRSTQGAIDRARHVGKEVAAQAHIRQAKLRHDEAAGNRRGARRGDRQQPPDLDHGAGRGASHWLQTRAAAVGSSGSDGSAPRGERRQPTRPRPRRRTRGQALVSAAKPAAGGSQRGRISPARRPAAADRPRPRRRMRGQALAPAAAPAAGGSSAGGSAPRGDRQQPTDLDHGAGCGRLRVGREQRDRARDRLQLRARIGRAGQG